MPETKFTAFSQNLLTQANNPHSMFMSGLEKGVL